MKATPIREYMTSMPHTIGEDIPLQEAIHRMREEKIRHLPVLKGGKLVGILSDRDIKLVSSTHPQITDLKVGDVMTDSAYAVGLNTPLEEAVETMYEHKYGCTVIVDDGKTVGIFTANDALHVLGRLLREKGGCAHGHGHKH